jgi:putative membrane protein (TIGR04086 family)
VTLDARAVGVGAALALAVAVPPALVANALDIDEGSPAVFAFSAIIFVGLAVGGFAAGRRQPRTPFVHGAAAALVAYVAVQTVAVLLRVARGDDLQPAAYVFNGFLAAALGVVGALVASRRTAAT